MTDPTQTMGGGAMHAHSLNSMDVPNVVETRILRVDKSSAVMVLLLFRASQMTLVAPPSAQLGSPPQPKIFVEGRG